MGLVGAPPKPKPEEVDDAHRPSGVRDRDTTPAPAGAFDSMLASSRPTTVPEYDFQAMAGAASMRHATLKNLRIDATVPIPTGAETPPDLDLRLAFLLLHADGESSIAHIAFAVGRPTHDVLASFTELAALGLVRLAAGNP